MYESFELTEAECRQLLNAGLVGRVALCTPVGPHILPVNYAVVDDAVVVRTTPYSVLGTQARGSMCAVEIDQLDYERQRGWSVVVRGRADVITDADALEHVRRSWGPGVWAAGNRSLHIRVPCTEISGRRLGGNWNPVDDLPVRRVV
jgi:uncharacterized protein